MRFHLPIKCLSIIVLPVVGAWAAANDKSPRHRHFEFTYGGEITGLARGAMARIWLPVPPSDSEQTVRISARHLPREGVINREPEFGNEILSFEARADANGRIAFDIVYDVHRNEVLFPAQKTADRDEDVSRYLRPDARVPVGGKSLRLVQNFAIPDDTVAAARVLYDAVNHHMRYLKEGTGWGRGDADWACESGYGNCSDFHSVFMALARSKKIPVKFEIGFPLPLERGAGEIPGYHCWAKFRSPSRGWIGVDISEAHKNPKMADYYFGNLTENRVAFSTGRDLELVPRQSGPPLNFFVYPYVEIDGKPVSSDSIRCHFTYRDLGD
jgi:transglutaminase-like putative cysteine protease